MCKWCGNRTNTMSTSYGKTWRFYVHKFCATPWIYSVILVSTQCRSYAKTTYSRYGPFCFRYLLASLKQWNFVVQRVDPFYTATILHFMDLFKRYGSPVIILNLVRVRKLLIVEEVSWCWLFHHAVKGKESARNDSTWGIWKSDRLYK